MAKLFISKVLIKDLFFRMVLTGKQIIVTPLNKDHCAMLTYHQGEVSIP